MPWKVSCPVNERMMFVNRLEAGERMTDLAREFGISRKTGYKILNRYRKLGPVGLYDLSRAPHHCPHRTDEATVELILKLKTRYPTWGAKKLRFELLRREHGLGFPSIDTIHRILSRHGLVKKRKRRQRITYSSGPLRRSAAPNDIWSADFKGQFRLGNRTYCYPLTISDHYSRYLLECEALECTKSVPARTVFERVFEEHGLPDVIRTDNGSPFASRSLMGLTKLSVYWLKLGIDIERIEPGHPEQNGRHERMHLTLKQETIRPAAQNMLAQQERFDVFRHTYNNERPHEALRMQRPDDVYQLSKRSLPSPVSDPEYPNHDFVVRVARSGQIHIPDHAKRLFLGHPLSGELVGLRELDDDCWLVSFAHIHLGIIKKGERRVRPFDAEDEDDSGAFSTKLVPDELSPMLP